MANELPFSQLGSALSRRRFLGLGAGAAALIGSWRLGPWAEAVAPGAAVGTTGSALEVFTGGYPRSFAYRQTDILATKLTYSQWAQAFSPLNGILGKVLPEEVPTDPIVAQYFNQFKLDYPAKIVIEHFNGWARVPQFETTNWFAGFWLYAAGTPATAPIATSDTVIHVGDTSRFSMKRGLYHNRGDDIVIAAAVSGRPDFSQAEQVALVAIDSLAGTLTVTRAQYGSQAISFATGAYVAAHEVRGPYKPTAPLLWIYNYSPGAPKDPNGKTVIDAIINGMAPNEGLAAKFAPGGTLANFDGMTLDVMAFTPLPTSDVNNDGVVDGGYIDGVDVYGIGTVNFTQALRNMLGPNRIVVVDDGIVQRPDSASIGGVKREGFPTLNDFAFAHWSEGLMALQFWLANIQHQPAFCYPVYKILGRKTTNDSRLRLSLAAAAIASVAFSYWDDPDGGTAVAVKKFTIWDELVAGVAQASNWLGLPIAPPQHLVTQSADLFGGSGVSMSSSFTANLQGVNVAFAVTNPGTGPQLTVSSTTASPTLSFSLANVPLNGHDVVLRLDLMSDPEPIYPSTIARTLKLEAVTTGTTKVLTQLLNTNSSWFTSIVYLRGLPSGSTAELTFTLEGSQNVYLRNVSAFAGPDVVFRQFEHGAVFANPSQSPYTFNVAQLAPGVSYHRLQATPTQDTLTNNGQAVGSTLTIAAIDALFVISP